MYGFRHAGSSHHNQRGASGAIITWRDYRDGAWDIYAQRVLSDGSLGGGDEWCIAYDQMLGSSSSPTALSPLRSYREEILMSDSQGEELVRELYNEHSSELASILVAHPRLARRSGLLVLKYLPGIRGILAGKQMTMDSSQLVQVEALLEDMAALSSPALREYIQSVQQVLQGGNLENFGVAVEDDPEEEPSIVGGSRLFQNRPNPFNPDMWIPYQLSKPAEVLIKTHDVRGQLIRTLHLGRQPAGLYLSKDKAAYWNGKNEAGESVSSGIYFYTIQAGDFTATEKMIITK